MNINFKKIGLILGFLVICFILGYLIYILFFRPAPPAVPPEEIPPSGAGELPISQIGPGGEIITTGPGGGLPTAEETSPSVIEEITPPTIDKIAQGKTTESARLTQSSSLNPVLASNGSDILYYNRDDGKFYRMNNNGDATLLTDKTFFQVQNVTWSKDKNKAIIEYPDGANILYNFSTKKQITLPQHWQDFDFSAAGGQIVAKSIGLSSDNRWLVTANEDGSGAKLIEPLGDNADKVYSSWSPNNLSIALYTESVDFDQQKVYFIGKNQENFKTTTTEGRGFQHQWTPDGQRLVYSVYSSATDLKPALWIVDAQGESIGSNRRQLGLQTWASKCAHSGSNTLYCAVPKSLPEGAGLFPQLADETSDNIYKINLETGSKTLIAIPDGQYNINNIIIPQNESNIYFTDKTTGRIYKIRMK